MCSSGIIFCTTKIFSWKQSLVPTKCKLILNALLNRKLSNITMQISKFLKFALQMLTLSYHSSNFARERFVAFNLFASFFVSICALVHGFFSVFLSIKLSLIQLMQ